MTTSGLLFIFLTLGSVLVNSGNIVFTETPLTIDYPYSELFFKWIKDDTVIAMTIISDLTEVWMTSNSGQTWKSLKNVLVGSELKASEPRELYPNPVDPKVFYIRGASTISWLTTDMGATWGAFTPTSDSAPKPFRNLEWHPKRSSWVLSRVDQWIYYSTDYGKTWKFIATATGYTWGDAGVGTVPDTTVYLLVLNKQSNYRDFVLTTDFGSTQSLVQSRTLAFLFLDRQLFTLLTLPAQGKGVLKVSPHIGSLYKEFYDSFFPFGGELDFKAYTILDDFTGAVYIGINDATPDYPWGNVYVSNSIGDKYSLSSNHVNQLNLYYDFHRIRGVQGIYISNVVQNWDENLPRTGSALRTFITVNNGGAWQALAAPHFDSNGQKITCTGRCNLHLHGLTTLLEGTSFGPVYTTESAIGLILGTGNIGESLLTELDTANTYLSRDAGLTWIELMKGNTIYEYGDHGSIIALAPFGNPTTKLFYTLDEGATPVKNITISSTPFDILNIRVEPTATGEKFIVIGQRNGVGVVIGVDFSLVFDRTCTDSEYESWSPSNGNPQLQCLLGMDVIYRRRNQTALCFNSETIDPILSTTYCPCTESDWECDLGFEKDSNGNCVFTSNIEPTYPPTRCPAGETYNKTKGYRPVAGTACLGGISHWGDGPFDCPSSGGKSYGWVAAVVIVSLVVITLIVTFVAIRSEWVREKVPFVKKLHGWKVGYFGMQNQPETIGEELEDSGNDEFIIGGEEDEGASRNPNVKLDDGFNPRG